MKIIIAFLALFLFTTGCKQKNTLFKQISSSHSGIHFKNQITENDSINILDMENIYNGGGVGIGDFNKDGLPDIYFSGNMVSNKLYLNKGGLKFNDITEIAGVAGEGKWARGVSIVDINNDGWPDIYISETFLKDSIKRENILYINQGLNKDSIPVFKDMAKEYELNDDSYTTQAAFFDYDNDGDVDVYLAVNGFAHGDNPNIYRNVLLNGEHPNTDRLYRNDWDSVKGHPHFTNVSRQAGILQEGFAHAVTICDINLDGWKDVYITNDYLSQNILYINNANGTFTNECKDYFKHTAFNAMGADVVDINNDGLSDVIELDMNPEDNYRKKTMMGAGSYQTNLYNDIYNYQYQYVRNVLQLNMGNMIGKDDSIEHPVFSDISFYGGIAETDWSWAPIVADFDNDGFRDMIVTNGFPRDVTDHDFMAYRNSAFAMNDKKKVLSQIPEVKIDNYAFRNNGNLTFSNVTKEWGMDQPSFSNGGVAVDLDNDGDLDVVVNSINDEALIYENKLNEYKDVPHNFLKVSLKGNTPNKDAFGAWVKIYYNNNQQAYETNPVRGYLSSGFPDVYFGLGNVLTIDSLIVIWPGNKKQKLIGIKVNQRLILNHDNANENFSWQKKIIDTQRWFKEISDSISLKFNAEQKDFNDFSIQTLLPHKLSQYGPQMAVGDINNDGLEDLVIGGSAGNSTAIFIQKASGKFERKNLVDSIAAASRLSNDAGILLFDADGDKDLDLYVASGGYEQKPGSEAYQDRFYVNEGKGNFRLDTFALSKNHNSKSCVRAIDFDRDGDADLFIGERVEPWQYPKHVSGILLRNDSKNGIVKFTDVTSTVASSLQNIGLICDAIPTDYNNDGWTDLIITGEWMPVTFLKNDRGTFINETKQSGIADKFGWWNCITAVDMDHDGKTDYIAGNLGKNSFFNSTEKYPINNYFNDFDNNGKFESIITKFLKDKNGVYKEYLAESRDEIITQLPGLKKKFPSFKSFGEATIEDLFSKEQLNSSLKSHANYFATSYIHNLGNGKFQLKPLPAMAQLAPCFNVIAEDFNYDSNPDILLSGNDYGAEVSNGRLDGLNGLVLSGNGKGGFTPLSFQQSGIYIPGDSRALVKVKNKNGEAIYICSQNKGLLKGFVKRR